MKKLTMVFTLAMFVYAGAAMAEDGHQHMTQHGEHDVQTNQHEQHSDLTQVNLLHQVEPSKTCMVNDTAFDKEQIAVNVDGKTYYGCCAMCEGRLKQDVSIRMATDPVSGVEVDKASAVIGADSSGKVYYFENEENLQNFTNP